MGASARPDAAISRLNVSAYDIPTEVPESDGTFAWSKTTAVVVELEAAGCPGLGYTYADPATAVLIDSLKDAVVGRDAFDIAAVWAALVGRIRNLGRPGICSMATAAIDIALWDLKSRLLGLPLARLLGQAHESVEAYGSGGFTSYSIKQLQEQLSRWAEQGFGAVKMKVGSRPEEDAARVAAARQAIGAEVRLYVDANGAYSRKQALRMAESFAEAGATWFEEPVSSDDLEGLRLIRDQGPPGLDIAAGEYGYDLVYFRRMLEAGAVDVLQADATRCAGITEFMRAAALAASHSVRFSAHTAPSLHTPLCCAALPGCNVEYFYDHARIEQLLFDGAPRPANGMLRPDLTRPGLGLELKHTDAAGYRIYGNS
ncbi:MAG TPA: enolase C-terminal domain-like protein [Bryobacteraceae bacterium]|nr:enolase C-terminal domain-like protein [Bryobacteraceae bacterium]